MKPLPVGKVDDNDKVEENVSNKPAAALYRPRFARTRQLLSRLARAARFVAWRQHRGKLSGTPVVFVAPPQ